MAVPDFSKIWASQSSLTPYEFSDEDYLDGWEFIGEIPPDRRMLDTWQRQADTKMQWLKNNMLGYLLRQNSTQYAVGDVAFSASLPSSLVLECTTAGTTGATEPSFSGATEGDTVKDGSVVWTYKNLLGVDSSTFANTDLSNLTEAGNAKFEDTTESVVYEDGFAIIYPNGGTAANPATVARNTRYVEPNPFPGYSVMCICEIYLDNNWGDPCFAYYNGGYGIAAHQLNDDLIVVQAGNSYTVTKSTYTGSPLGFTGEALATPQICRAKVWKIGKAANNA